MIHHRLKTYLSIRHWISHARRQSKHVQHMYAFFFAGSITALIASAILYFDYGFWQEQPTQKDTITTQEVQDVSKDIAPPGETLTNFFIEAKGKWNTIKIESKELFESTETYSRDEATN